MGNEEWECIAVVGDSAIASYEIRVGRMSFGLGISKY